VKDRIDWHVNLLPDWARGDRAEVDLSGESESLQRAYRHADARRINRDATAGVIVSAMEAAGVSKAVCFSYQWKDAGRCRSGNDTVRQALQDHPTKLYGLAVVQPREQGAADELERMLDTPGVLGLKMKPKWGGFSLADIRLLGPLCETLTARNKVLLTHVSQNFDQSEGDHMGDLFRLLAEFPKLVVVAAHLGGFSGVYECYAPARKLMRNLFIDVSLPANLAWLPHLMRLGDPRRYLYATDFPYQSFGDLNLLLDGIGLNDEELEMLCVTNPQGLLTRLTG
jgi:uncharacterized protein